MSRKSNRPQHDRSKRIKDFENNAIIQLIESEDGVVSKRFSFALNFFKIT
jgi:hypothetical protein